MIRKLLVVAAAIAMPVSVIAVSGGIAGAAKGPSAATDTATCTTLSATVHFSIPLTLTGSTSGTEVTTISGTYSGCSASGAFPISITSGTISGTFTSKPGSAKHPTAGCANLSGVSKEKGSIVTTWNNPAAGTTTTIVKSITGGTAGGHGTFQVNGKYKGSFGGADKGKTSTNAAQTSATVAAITAQCSSGGVSSLSIVGPASGHPLVLQ